VEGARSAHGTVVAPRSSSRAPADAGRKLEIAFETERLRRPRRPRGAAAARDELRAELRQDGPKNTALTFLLLGWALLLLDVGKRGRASDLATIPAAVVSFAALCGYLYDARPLYRIGPFISIALPTILGFLAARGARRRPRPPPPASGIDGHRRLSSASRRQVIRRRPRPLRS